MIVPCIKLKSNTTALSLKLQRGLKEHNFDLSLNTDNHYPKTHVHKHRKHFTSELCKLQHKPKCFLPTNYFFCGLVTALSQRDGTCGKLNE